MGLEDLYRAQLNTIIQSMVAEGVVNNQFVQLQTMKVTAGKDFMLRSVISYWKAVKYLFTQLTNQMDMNVWEFDIIMACARDLFERSNCVGAVYVSFACRDIIEGCHAGDKNRCIISLVWAKMEFTRLQIKLETIVEMERKILDYEDKRDT